MIDYNKTILLADDDEDDRYFFSLAVESLSREIKLLTFDDGVSLLHHLENKMVDNPAILFLDINMPVLNGHQCLEQIRASPKWKDLPIAMYTTSNHVKDIEKSKDLGANVFIKKPFKLNVLIEIIQWVLSIDWSNTNLTSTTYYIDADNWRQ